MATKTLRVFAEYTSTGFVPMPTAGNIDYGFTLGSTFPATTPATYQTDNPDLVVTVSAMTDFYVWIRVNGQAWNPSYTRNVRVYPDSANINNVVVNMIIATGPAGVSSYTQIIQTSNRLYFNGATTDATYNSKFAGKTYINELNFGTAPGLATVATTGAYADLTGKPTLATVATSGLFTDLSSKPSGTAPLSYNSGTNSFVIAQATTSVNGYLSSTDWNTFNNKLGTPAGTTLQYVDGTGALQTFPVLASADKLVINVRNSSGVSMPKGSVVYINGATGNKPTVALSQANSDATSAQTLGLLQATLANNSQGNVVIVGSVIDLNTSAFTEGQQLYLSPTTAGAYTTTKPYAPNHLVYVGVVTRSHVSLGVIEVKVQNGYEMDELHDVSAQSPSNNDGLFYNTTTSLWEKKSIATLLGYTPYNGTDTSIKALFSASAPLSYSNGVYSISQATTASNGYLSSTDWNTFSGKESVLSFTTPLVRTTNTISINQASTSTSGYLSSTDWNTFNNKGSGSGSVTSVAMTMPLGLSVSGSPITTSGTLALSLTAGYVIPTTSSATQWDSAYTNRITSLTVTGSSGASTLISNVLNIPTYTLVGLGGQVALNGTGFVKATGTTISYDNTSYLPLSGGLMTSSIQFSDTTNLKRGIYGSMGTDDNWFVGVNAGGVSQGYLEIATGDDGTEPIYATQYTGDAYTTGTVARRVKILDESGNSIFPNTLTATTLVKSGGTSSQYLMADGSVSTITNNITGTGTINELAYFNTASTVASLAVATYPSLTELSYVKGVTSAIQTQLNAKQNTITNPVTGTGTTNYISKFTSSSAIGNSLIFDTGTAIGVGTASPDSYASRSSLSVNGTNGGIITLQLGGTKVTEIYCSTAGLTQFTTTGSFGFSGGATSFSNSITLSSLAATPSYGSGSVGINLGYTNLQNVVGIQSCYANNVFYDGTNWKSITNSIGYAQAIRLQNGHIDFHSASVSTSGQTMANWDTTDIKMRITSTGNVGIGTSSPTSTSSFQRFLHIAGGASLNSGLCLSGQNTGGQGTIGYDSSVLYIDSLGATIGANNTITFNTTSANGNTTRLERMRITAEGNLGFGMTPYNNGLSKAIDLVGGGGMFGFSNNFYLFGNGYFTDAWRYKATGGLSIIELSSAGNITFSTAGSGSANASASPTEKMRVSSDGNLGIGGTPTAKLHVFTANNSNGGNAGASFNNEAFVIGATGKGILMQYDQNNNHGHIGVVQPGVAWGALVLQGISGNVLIGTNSNPGYKLYVSGTIYATGNITANSDLTLKKNLKLIDNPIDKLMQLNGYAYQWKSNDNHQYGVIAQEVEKILPYAVSTGNDGIKGVSYNQIIPVLIEAIKTQQAEINTLKSKLA